MTQETFHLLCFLAPYIAIITMDYCSKPYQHSSPYYSKAEEDCLRKDMLTQLIGVHVCKYKAMINLRQGSKMMVFLCLCFYFGVCLRMTDDF